MPLLESKTILKGTVELVISVPVDELESYLVKAAEALQTTKPISGFRPGKAPYEAVRQALGAMAVYEASLRFAVPRSYAEIVTSEHLQTIGDPEFQVLKLSPEQPLQFSAKVALLPDVKLGDYKTIRIKRSDSGVPDADLDEVLNELRDMRSTTVLVDRAATKKDRVMIDLNMSHAGVPLEGGQAKNHGVDLFKPYVIDGFLEELVGVKSGDEKKFSLPFPSDHYDKNVAGKTVDYDVKVKGVHEFTRPELTDEFAKTVGKFETMDELKKQLRENLEEVHRTREEQRLEREIMDKLIERTTFGDIPETLVASEVERILWRIKNQVESEGGTWEDYLEHMKKSEADFARDVLPEAYTRVKAQLLVRAVAEAENITVTPDEVESERDIILSHYPTEKDNEVREQVKSPDYDRHIEHLVFTRKVLGKLKEIATS